MEQDKFIQSGTYAIMNRHYNNFLSDNGDEQVITSSTCAATWKITMLKGRKWTIESLSNNLFACIEDKPQAGDDVCLSDSPHPWVIKQLEPKSSLYVIYPFGKSDLLWGFSCDEEESKVKLGPKNDGTEWEFEKVDEKQTQDITDIKPLSVDRPTVHSTPSGNTVTMTIPPGWYATITAFRLGKTVNLISLKHAVMGDVDIQNLVSVRDETDRVLRLEGTDTQTYDIPAYIQPALLSLEFFHSKNKFTHLSLPENRVASSVLSIISLNRPEEMRIIPDYQTFLISEEEDPAGKPPMHKPDQSRATMAALHFVKQEVDLVKLGVPPPGSVNEGYSDTFDKPRPDDLAEYLENYDLIFVIDDSGSLSGSSWEEVGNALAPLVDEAMQYGAHGIEICFLNSPLRQSSFTSKDMLLDIFNRVQPHGCTPTGAKLQLILDEMITKLDQARGTPAYARIKPVDLIVLTNSEPTDDPAAVLLSAALRLHAGKHHPNAVGIQFLQVGNEKAATEALKNLAEVPARNMVDVVTSLKSFTLEQLKRVLFGAVKPSIRGLMNPGALEAMIRLEAARKAAEEAEAARKAAEEANAARKAEEEAKAARKAEEEAKATRKAAEAAEAARKAAEQHEWYNGGITLNGISVNSCRKCKDNYGSYGGRTGIYGPRDTTIDGRTYHNILMYFGPDPHSAKCPGST